MKMNTTLARLCYALMITTTLFACTKEDMSSNDDSSQAIPVTTSNASGSDDTVYVMHTPRSGEQRDSIAQAEIRTSIKAYVEANYDDALFRKAFVVRNSGGVVAYIIIIQYNGRPVALLFNAEGEFKKVLEQREKRDLRGPGHHHGGLFEYRDGQHRDTIALANLAAVIKTYIAVNLSGENFVRAFRCKDGHFVIITRSEGHVYANIFTASGAFKKRVQLTHRHAHHIAIEFTQLSQAAINYLTETYPNYVFKKAFKISVNGSVVGYLAIVDANNTKYAVEFDATGKFVSAKTIR